ncbi:MAG: hypothetical protein GC165_10255 [Armatimonadetes bacterium]|nr:hypothetical protein [Armatimonadota bacterium]
MKTSNISPLQIRSGCSQSNDAATAVRELYEALHQEDVELTMFFCSSNYNLAEIEAEVNRLFPGKVVGCTTAGEIGPSGFTNSSITGMSFSGDVRADLYAIDLQDCSGEAHRIGQAIADKPKSSDAERSFAVLLVDGLSLSEEHLVAALYQELGEVPIIGGSAGDDLKFEKTYVFSDGKFQSGMAVFTTIATHHAFQTVKFQHFEPTPNPLVVTASDPAIRVVKEINGLPAAEVYAAELGVSVEDFNSTLFASHPLILELSGEVYVRSIQSANADGSLTLFCAIEDGVILSVGRALDPMETARKAFDKVAAQIGRPQLTIGSSCILRRLEFNEKNINGPMSEIYLMNNVVGFNTYGEQWDAVHVNQTFTGIAIGA